MSASRQPPLQSQLTFLVAMNVMILSASLALSLQASSLDRIGHLAIAAACIVNFRFQWTVFTGIRALEGHDDGVS